jgi:hypothetical protein
MKNPGLKPGFFFGRDETKIHGPTIKTPGLKPGG